MAGTHTFILSDKQCITRLGMRWLIRQLYIDAQITEATDRHDLLTLLRRQTAAIVVLDYALSDFRKFEELLVVSARYPKVHWVIFSGELSEPFVRRFCLEPAFSLLLKDSSSEEIKAALTAALTGKSYHSDVIQNLVSHHASIVELPILTPTEREVLHLIAMGKSVKEIATLRNSSVHTIVTHKKNLFRKLEVNTTYEATRYALRVGLVELAEYYI